MLNQNSARIQTSMITNARREELVVSFIREHLSPKDEERSEISQRYKQLEGFLSDHTFQSGSYARFTSTTPVNDLDVIYELPEEVRKAAYARHIVDPTQLDLNDIVTTLAEELDECYGKSARIVPESPSVSIYFGDDDEFSIDVVPSLPAENGMVWIPEIAHLSSRKRREYSRDLAKVRTPAPPPTWIRSDPRGYIKQASSIDETTDGCFRKTAKAMKKWRWVSRDDAGKFPLRSFHLELAVTRWFENNPEAACVESITRIIEDLPQLIVRPQFVDLADRSRFVDAYVRDLNHAERRLLSEHFAAARNGWDTVLRADSDAAVRDALFVFFGTGGTKAAPVAILARTARKVWGIAQRGPRDPGEMFLSDRGIRINIQFEVHIDARVQQDGFTQFWLRRSTYPLARMRSLLFSIRKITVPGPYEVFWKIKNTGKYAGRDLRGEIVRDEGRERREERTAYWGNHYVECYVVKDGVCVAADHIDVLDLPRKDGHRVYDQ